MTKLVIETGSDNTIKAFNFLKENEGSEFTIKEVAEALGLSSAQVTGGLVSLRKKEAIAAGEEREIENKSYKTFASIPGVDVEFVHKAKNEGKLSDNAVRLLQWLQANPDVEMTHAEIAEEMGWQTIQVVGAATGLANKGLATKPDLEFEMPDGKTKTLKVVLLTDEGKAYKF